MLFNAAVMKIAISISLKILSSIYAICLLKHLKTKTGDDTRF